MFLPLLFAFFVACSAESVALVPAEFPDVAASFYANKADASPCNSIALQSCQVQFNRYLGIQDELDWHDSITFYNAINSRIYNNTAGLLRVCGAYSLFYQCLGTTYSSCVNPLFFIQSGLSVNQAFQYVQAIHSLQFKCYGGFEQSIMKWAGIINIFNTHTSDLNACFSDFSNSINANFSNYCTAVFHLENCFSSLFIGLGSEISWWACEDIRVGFSYTFCPDSGNLLCRPSRRRGGADNNSAQTDVSEFNEHDKNKVDIGMSKIILDYPPEPNQETA